MHHVEAGPDGSTVLLLHGEPTWSYLYRKMVAALAAAGHRVVAPDLIGFGRSDKPAELGDHSYRSHIEWMLAWLQLNGLRGVTLVCQDWGSLIGLRLVAEQPERFERVVVANGFLPTGDRALPPAFKVWRGLARRSPVFPAGAIVQAGCVHRLPAGVRRAYDAPFPDSAYKAGPRAFPRLVPTAPDDPEAAANRRAWRFLQEWRRPVLTVFGTWDPFFSGLDQVLQRRLAGAAGRPHRRLLGAGHFIQEDRGGELARIIQDFIVDTAA